ncbi:Similar to Pitx3: Pituitary homeobox 3 (Rattus norvegicus) [Cotesia congregata]|uniref:Similar to Pitx3: Pituitary homeobox 3 (Rattus norvegicus) n=1 Tax=Cotesia congregata TaxID=51543 RepID=A0A8J2EKJ0_COTCN|nr:Similar to Pitx3: Pituitary homeobox 3 (Rattus norvegicus) [Cotesia congregata]
MEKKQQKITFTKDQCLFLEETFRKNRYPRTSIREQIAESLGLTERQVNNWFGNRRRKERDNFYQNVNQDQTCQVDEQKENWYQNVNQGQNRQVEE